MASKFIDLESAAAELGISVDKLSEMRERNEIRGFRDGSTWKFKVEDLEQVKNSLDAGGSELNLDDGDDADKSPRIPDSILLSEGELGGSGPVGSSTVIGQQGGSEPDLEDARVTVDALDTSDIQLTSDSLILGGSDGDPSSDVLGADAADSPADAGSEIQLTGSDNLDLELDLSDSSPTADPGADLSPESDALSFDASSNAPATSDSEIDMTGDDEDILVLGGTGSDVVGASDSGISLGDPADSGISLEGDSMNLGGSALGEDSLLLGEEDFLSADSGAAAGSSPSQLGEEDDFLLTPLEDAMGDDSESSSQVIALDDPDMAFDPNSNTMMDQGADADLALLDPGTEGEAGAAELIGVTEAPVVVQQMAIPEAPYSSWNVVSLFLCIVLLTLSGMLVYDLVRQIWSWEGVHPVNSGLMNAILNMFR